jgi:hypothetical protein
MRSSSSFLWFLALIVLFLIFFFSFFSSYSIPKVIYTYWDHFEENEIVQTIVSTWSAKIPGDWKINILSAKNVHHYVDPKLLERWMALQDSIRFSDFLRIYLLSTHGGVWMDAGILVINGSFLDTFRQEMMHRKMDILLYEFKVFSLPNQPYLENWFFMCPQNSRFMKDLYHEFSRSLTMGFISYKNQVLAPHVSFKYIRLQGDDTYHMQHGIINYLVKTKTKKYSMLLKNATDSMFKAQEKNGWDNEKLIHYLLENKDWSSYYSIKLTGANREPITARRKEFIEKWRS